MAGKTSTTAAKGRVVEAPPEQESLPETEPALEAPVQAEVKVDADLRTKAYSAGMKRLREENLEKFRGLVQEEAKKLGFTYVFQPTAEEKAAAEAEALFAAHPGLREKLLASQQQA